MNKRATLAIDADSAEIIDRQVEAGNFDSPSEVVRAGLQLLKEQQAQLERLRAALIEGEESGEPQPFDFDAFLERKNREYNQRAK